MNSHPGNPASRPPVDDTFWTSIRDDFPLDPDYLHLSQFYMVSHPKRVTEAIRRHRRRIDDNPFLAVSQGLFGDASVNQVEPIYQAAARYMGAGADEIALIPNSTTGLGLIYHGLPLKAGDEVLCTCEDHFTQHEAIRLATARVGASWRKFQMVADSRHPCEEDMLGRLRSAIRPETRVLGITWVSSQTGLRLPVREITALVARINRIRRPEERILTVVDGTHGFGALEDPVSALGADYFISSTHKWLFAPRGTGIIHAPRPAWERLQPVIPTYYSWDLWQCWSQGVAPVQPTQPRHFSPGGFLAYEHQWAMTEAFQYHLDIGRERIAHRIHQLNGLLMARLAGIPGLKLHTPEDPRWSAGIVGFDVMGLDPARVVERLLQRKVIASVSPYAEPCVRLSAGIMNSETEIEQAAGAVAEIVHAHRRGAGQRIYRAGSALGRLARAPVHRPIRAGFPGEGR